MFTEPFWCAMCSAQLAESLASRCPNCGMPLSHGWLWRDPPPDYRWMAAAGLGAVLFLAVVLLLVLTCLGP